MKAQCNVWATVCKTVRPMLSVRCLSVSSVCAVCDVRTLWPDSWMNQDEAWRAGRPRPWPHCVRRGPSSRSPKGTQPPQFSAHSRSNGWMDQDATSYGGRPRPRRLCVGWGPSCPFRKRGRRATAAPPHFSPMSSYCGQTVAISATAELLYKW